MSYELALEAAGAKVIDTHYAGDYQGTWGSVVEYKGKTGLVTGYYGSCSHCDAFQSEFDDYSWGSEQISYNAEKDVYTKDYGDTICTKEEYEAQQAEYQQKLSDFGKGYLHVIQDRWDIENQLANPSNDDWYDEEKRELLNWALPILLKQSDNSIAKE
jgi:hypothetical protein